MHAIVRGIDPGLAVLDSVIEFFAAAVVAWQLPGERAGAERETRAVRLIGVTLFALAAYLTAAAIADLAAWQRRPGTGRI